ncbi:MAG TPA: MBL fold metallo-hydrolase, partial [Terriglobales bacterium]
GTAAVRWFGALRWADVRISSPLSWQVVGFCLLLGTAMLFARSSLRWMRRSAWAALFLAATLSVLPRGVQHPADALLVQAFDVGQGDSLLLITPDGKTMLIDAGGPSGRSRSQARTQEFDFGEEVVSPALWARGIRHLDVVALSHAHSDHMGGMAAILRNFHPNQLWVGNNPSTPAYEALLQEARRVHTSVRQLRAGDSQQLGLATIRILAPFANYRPGSDPANNDSLVLRVQFGATSVPLEGDAEEPIENRMLSEPDLQSTLLKVGHHGSVTSTSARFLARVMPQWAVISCGVNNHYGHPRPEVLRELQDAHVHTFSTDANGGVCFALDGSKAWTLPCE